MARILLITHISPPAVDGGSRVIHKVGEYLERSGHEVASLSSDASSTDDFSHPYSKVPKLQSSKALYFRLPVYTIFHRPLKLLSRLLPIFNVFAKGPVFKIIPFLKFLTFYLRFKPDYIIAGPLPTTIALYANFLKFLSKTLTFHSTKVLINSSFHPTDKDFHNPLLIQALKSFDFLWTLTDYETNYFHQHFGIPLSKMINVGNGVDSSLLTKAPKLHSSKAPKLIFLGSFASHKGIETIIDAFIVLTKDLKFKSSKELTLTLAGQPTLYSSFIESKIKKLPQKVRSRINVVYKFKTKDLKFLLDQSSVLISASSQESFGIVLLEAMARGVPVIGSDIPATSELIRRSGAGLTFKTGDPVDLVKKIIFLNISKDLKLYSSKGRSYASNHTWDRIGESLWQKISSS
ncbi:glycosyltransferase family 4 protein [Candidatus Shapirobacteria bacterium]|nr:glycosyltransferase family 4 protein [Candidatus Shapirobacteria bacterium]